MKQHELVMKLLLVVIVVAVPLKQQETINEFVVTLKAAQENLSKLRGTIFPDTTEFVDLL
jgi:hypothetical protein